MYSFAVYFWVSVDSKEFGSFRIRADRRNAGRISVDSERRKLLEFLLQRVETVVHFFERSRKIVWIRCKQIDTLKQRLNFAKLERDFVELLR
jgi:hypothetical protein